MAEPGPMPTPGSENEEEPGNISKSDNSKKMSASGTGEQTVNPYGSKKMSIPAAGQESNPDGSKKMSVPSAGQESVNLDGSKKMSVPAAGQVSVNPDGSKKMSVPATGQVSVNPDGSKKMSVPGEGKGLVNIPGTAVTDETEEEEGSTKPARKFPGLAGRRKLLASEEETGEDTGTEGEEGAVSGPSKPLAEPPKHSERPPPKKFPGLAGAQHKPGRQKRDILAKNEEEVVQEVVEIEVEVPLVQRSDADLTKAQILEKDGLLYDMLCGDKCDKEVCDDGGLEMPTQKEEEETEEEESEEEEAEEEEDVEVVEQEQEEEEEEEDESPEEAAEMESVIDPNDPDNIITQLLQQEDKPEEDFKIVFFDQSTAQQVETVASYPGVVGITLSDETKEFLELENLHEQDPPHTFVSFKRIKLHMYIYGEKSEFYQHYDLFKNYPDFSMLMGYDADKSTGHLYYLCTTLEARNMVLNPPRKKKVFVNIKKKEEEAWAKMASLIPRKWESLGSEAEVESENVHYTRPLLTVYAYRDRDKFNQVCDYQMRTPDTNPDDYVAFESEKSETPRLESMEIDCGIQVHPPKATSTTQTGFSFKRNKIVQYEDQSLGEETVAQLMDVNADLVYKKSKPLLRAIQQNEMMNLKVDDYKHLKAVKGHEVEYNNESVLLQEYQTCSDLRHSKGRCVTWMVFHPTLEDVVVMSMAVDATFDKRIDFHSEMIMEPNFVLFWDLKDPIHPQFMLDSPNDVFSFMVNPSDPNLVCGGCANGQVVLWDLDKHHFELKSRIQDRRRKSKNLNKKRPSFLEKLKDKAEKYVCPLIPAAGLSNLDQSHKRVVTSVVWLPPHVEVGKNGTLYENSARGKSVQFFSTAGDGCIRLWDIRESKAGLEEYDKEPRNEIIKVNPWAHLENNQWRFLAKFGLDDGSGTMYATFLSLSEQKIGDTFSMDSSTKLTRSTTSVQDGEVEGPGGADPSKDVIPSAEKPSKEAVAGTGGPNTDAAPGRGGGSKESHKSGAEGGVDSNDEITGFGSVENLLESDSVVNATKKAAGMLKVLPDGLTSIFIGTEDGQIILVDWLRNKEGSVNSETGGRNCQNVYMETVHDGSITSMARSPFYSSLILVVGGGTISIWKEFTGSPLLATSGSELFPWCGCWSNTRPAVFFVGTREGAIQVWDLTEKSHAPVLIQQISPGRLTAIAIPRPSLAKKQFLAVGDSAGSLFVMLLPRYYYKPTQFENDMMQELMTREEKRITNWRADTEIRGEKIQEFHKSWKEKRVMKSPEQLLELEIQEESRLNAEYLDFLEFEAKLVGRLKRDEPALPTIGGDESDDDFDELFENALRREGELTDDEEQFGYEEPDDYGSDNSVESDSNMYNSDKDI